MQNDLADEPRKAIVASVQRPNISDAEFEASLAELRELAKTLGYRVVHTFTQKRAGFDTTGYLGVGKRQEVREFVAAQAGFEAAPTDTVPRTGAIEALLVDHEISPSQARNLELETGCEVMDRTMVILEIFHRNARSRAAKAQVEIARLGYMAPRLREAAKLAGPQGRQRSGVGGRGAGESHTELDRRKIRDRIAELQLEIVAMEAERKIQRARRQGRQAPASVALVGYTNAGKSTLMRALTGSEVLVANKLFATLDTTVRTLYPESVPRVLVSDTVGFIKNLPHGLVASFKSTLDEALDAGLLLHVIDASDPGFERQLEVTDTVLAGNQRRRGAAHPRLQQDRPRRRRRGAGRVRGGAAREIPRLHRHERAPAGRGGEAAADDRRILPAGPDRGGAVAAMVGAAVAQGDLRQLRGAGGKGGG
jgi:GTP-binding protein HflX